MKLTEFCDSLDKWHCGDYSDLANDSNVWYRLPRILGMSINDFVKTLADSNAIITWHKDSGLLFYCWDSQSDMRKFKNDYNKRLRKVGLYG